MSQGLSVISSTELEKLQIPVEEILRITEEAYVKEFTGEVEVPDKIGVHPTSREHSFFHAMPASLTYKRTAGIKWVSYFPGNSERGLDDSTAMVILNDYDTGFPLAVMDGMWITMARTAACATVFARHLIGDTKPRSIAFLGAGGLANWSLDMLAHEFPSLKDVRVVSRTAKSREKFAEKFAPRRDWTITPLADPQEAAADADIVVSAIVPQGTPPFQGEWVKPGAVIVALDTTHGWSRQTFEGAGRLVGDGESRLRFLTEKIGMSWDGLPPYEGIGALIAGETARDAGEKYTLGIPTGKASIDIALATALWEKMGSPTPGGGPGGAR